MRKFLPVSRRWHCVLVCISSVVRFFSSSFNSFRFPHTKLIIACCACVRTIFGINLIQNTHSQHANDSHIWERERNVSFRIHALYFIRCVLKYSFYLCVRLDGYLNLTNISSILTITTIRKRRREDEGKWYTHISTCTTYTQWQWDLLPHTHNFPLFREWTSERARVRVYVCACMFISRSICSIHV